MVKVFLVEDESIIRRGIRDNIAWESHGFEFGLGSRRRENMPIRCS